MNVFSSYSELAYYRICHTNVSRWYENKYKKMIERGESTIDFTPNHKLEKQEFGGGHHTNPKKGFFINSSIYELDAKGMYPTIVINNNFSFDTLNCICCKHDLSAIINKDTIDMISQNLRENKIDRRVSNYWICKKRKGAFPLVLQKVLSDREHYLKLLKEEKSRSNPDKLLIEEYQTYQIGAKLFANAGFGLFGNKYFEFSNYKVAECITGEGRRIHKQMESLAKQQPFDFDIVFGFTDSIFVKVNEIVEHEKSEDERIKHLIAHYKKELGITVEIKNKFVNSISYGKRNRFLGWSGKENEELFIKGLDGLAKSNPLWVRKWLYKIINELIAKPEKRFEMIPNLLKEAIFELENEICKSDVKINQELKFTQKLKNHPNQYEANNRTGFLGRLLEKDKGEEVYWFETICIDKHTKGNFSTTIPTPENLNLQKYKSILLDKLEDTLEITGFNINRIRLEILENMLPLV